MSLRPTGMSVTLHSPLSLAECRERLSAAIDSPWALFSAKRFVGAVTGDRVFATKRLPPGVRNSFQPCLTGVMVEDSTGTTITCRFGMHPLVSIFMIAWVSGVVLIGGTIMVASIGELLAPHPPDNVWIGVLTAPGMLIFAAALAAGGYGSSSWEKDALLGFLRATLEAT